MCRRALRIVMLLVLLLAPLLAGNMARAEEIENTTETKSENGKKNAIIGRRQEIDDALQKSTDALHIPGMAVAIVDSDEILFEGVYGNCTDINSPFLIGSLSKSFTALSIMQLVEEDKIKLDETISTYIDVTPYLKKPEEGSKITVRELLNQTSGLATYQRLGNAEMTDTYGKHNYANVNYGLLGKIIESVSEESYSSYIKKHIFEPLGMQHSAGTLAESKADGLIPGYRNYFGIPIQGEPDYPRKGSWSTVSAGYISSSVADMEKYLQMYLKNGEGVACPYSIQTMFYDNVYVDSDMPYYYGMGWTSSNGYGEPFLSHSGLVENYMSVMMLLPQSDIGVIMLINENDYLVTLNYTTQLSDNMIRLLRGYKAREINPSDYWVQHGLLDAAYLLLLIVSLLPLLLYKKWKRKMQAEGIGCKGICVCILIHGILPTIIWNISAMLSTPLWVVWYYVKDLFLVLVISAGLLYMGGILKLRAIYQRKRKG